MDAISSAPSMTFHLFTPSGSLPDLPLDPTTNQKQLSIEEEVSTDINILDQQTEAELQQWITANIYAAEIVRIIALDNIEMRNSLRNDKRLLILDIDSTLCDPDVSPFPSTAATRPFLTEFLSQVYRHYDIGVWSNQNTSWTSNFLEELRIIRNESYEVAFFLTESEMITLNTPNHGLLKLKPLEVIWRKFPQYSAENTIIIDDTKWNFLMNHQSGLQVRKYNIQNKEIDREMKRLGRYLEVVAPTEDFRGLDHKLWRQHEQVLRVDVSPNVAVRDPSLPRNISIKWHDNLVKYQRVKDDVTIEAIRVLVSGVIGVEIADLALIFFPRNIPVAGPNRRPPIAPPGIPILGPIRLNAMPAAQLRLRGRRIFDEFFRQIRENPLARNELLRPPNPPARVTVFQLD